MGTEFFRKKSWEIIKNPKSLEALFGFGKKGALY